MASGATLTGSGSIGTETTAGAVTVQSGGTLTPGVSGPGTLTLNNGLTVAAGGTVVMQLNGATAGTGFDQLVVKGAVNLNGASLTTSLGYTPGGNDSFTIIDNDGTDAVVGTFSSLAEGATINLGGTNYIISYAGGTGNDVVVRLPNTVPTLTSFAAAVATTNEDTQKEITLANLKDQGNEADSDGTVDAFVVQAVSTGTLKIGTSAGTATAWDATTNNTVDATNHAYWTPASNANGSALNAFTVVAKDNLGGVSTTAVQATANVTEVNDAPILSAGTLTAVNVSEDSANSTAANLGLSAVAYGPGGASDEGGQTLTYTVTAVPSFVTLFKADGTTAITASSTVTASELQGLTYKTVANSHGTGNITWTVVDSGGTANSGVDTLSQNLGLTVNGVADTPSVTDATAIANAQNSSGLVLSRNAADGAETTHFKITGITGGSLYKNDGTTAIANDTFITFAEGNGLKFTPSGTTAGSFTAQASTSNVDGGLGGSTVNATINVATPTITSATYDATTGTLIVTGTNLPAFGAGNDIDISKFTVTGEGGDTVTLTGSGVEITSATSFTITLGVSADFALNTLLNKAGLTSTDGTAYNLAANIGWARGFASTPADLVSNPITVSNVPVPTLTRANYNAATGELVLVGRGLLKSAGPTNDIAANKFTFTAEGGATYTLTDTASVEITSDTAATITLSAIDKTAINLIVNKNGTSSTDNTIYNIAAAEDWAAGAEAAVVVADLTGNGITVSAVSVPTLTSATYDTGTGVLVVTGTGLFKKAGATNDIDISKLKLTGQGSAGAGYTLTSASDVEITSGTSFTVTLSGADKTAVDALLNKTGTSANDNTVYVIGGLEDWAAGADADVDVVDEAGNAITVTVFVPPPPPPPPPAPAPVVETVDGTTVQTDTSTQTGSDGNITTTTTQTVAPVTTTRPEDPNTPNSALADIPLAVDSTGTPTVQISLPVGVGLTSESTSTNTNTGGTPLTLRERLIAASDPRIEGDAPMQEIIANGIDLYVPSVSDQAQVTVRTITLTVAPPAGGGSPTAPTQPIVIRGATGTGESDPLNPQRGEALVIDARNLPPGTVLDLSMVEFAIIIGPSTVTGGTGQNYVIGDGSRQFIVLGPEDDVIRGGAGDDTVGSKGGNDQLFGDEGNDWVVGGTGNDTLQGGDGNDILQGGASDAGTWSFKLNAQGQLQASFVPASTELADSMGLSATDIWTAPSGRGEATDSRFAWVYDDYAVAKDAALLVQALAGRLPTLTEMGGLADGAFSSQQLSEMAYSYWKHSSTFVLDTVRGQMAQVINKVWGANSATSELIDLGVNHINEGGSWAAVWLALARHSTHANKITDAQGNISLINQRLSDTGWSANSGDDKLFGGAGNDVLVGGNGNDELDGGTGTDMAVWLGAIADYQVALTPSTAQGAEAGAHDALVRNKLTGEVDTVRNVELIKIGHSVYAVPPGQPQPSDGVFVELSGYVQPVIVGQLAGVAFNNEWAG